MILCCGIYEPHRSTPVLHDGYLVEIRNKLVVLISVCDELYELDSEVGIGSLSDSIRWRGRDDQRGLCTRI
jgi:hypothetical protein